jgi:hypothetical protein
MCVYGNGYGHEVIFRTQPRELLGRNYILKFKDALENKAEGKHARALVVVVAC